MDGDRESSVAEGDVDWVADVEDRAGDRDSSGGEGIDGIELWPVDCGR